METSARMGTTAAIVEKDFWVCWVLEKIFTSENLKHKLLFKGGTSLSKVYNVIERFSEDIDLILDWNLVSGKIPARRDQRIGRINSISRSMNMLKGTYILSFYRNWKRYVFHFVSLK